MPGACQSTRMPVEAAATTIARLQGIFAGPGRGAGGAPEPPPGVAPGAGRLPVHQDAGGSGRHDDRQAPGDLRGSCSGSRHSVTFSLLWHAVRYFWTEAYLFRYLIMARLWPMLSVVKSMQ